MGLRSLAADLLPTALQGGLWPGRASGLQPQPEVASFAALSEVLAYLPKGDLKLVREAFKFADAAHLGQFRTAASPTSPTPLPWPACVQAGVWTRRPSWPP